MTAVAWTCAAVLLVAGAGNAWAGSAIHRRHAPGRLAALGLAVPNLFVLPFVRLGIAMWVLLHDESRRMFVKELEAKIRSARPVDDLKKTVLGFDENVAGALAYGLGWITGWRSC